MLLFWHIDFLTFGFTDLLDILFVAMLLYLLYNLIKGSVAVRMLVGGLFLFASYWLFDAIGMQLVSAILGQFINVGVVAIIIIFQAEIKKFLFVIGKGNLIGIKNSFWDFLGIGGRSKGIPINVFMEAAQELSITLTGALIVFTKGSDLRLYADTGDAIDALPSKRLIHSIFYKNSPLHDGAMIVDRNGRIVAARCILPVSENTELPASLGLRHRSAIGLSELTDAIILTVSEETGYMSLVKNGEIRRNLTYTELRKLLIDWLTMEEEEEKEEESKREDNLPSSISNEPTFVQVKT